MKSLLIIDGNSILNRAFYGVRPLTNSAGLPTNALFGMLSILQRQLNDIKPDYAAIAFDLPAPTFRHKEYAEYKAGRKKMPDELAAQLPYSKRLSEALGLTVLELSGYEADDILGTVSAMAEKDGVKCFVLTGDRDSLQLISDGTSVLLATNSDTVKFDRAAFFEKYGFMPESFVDMKALMGDSSDNIPGVPGIGEKTAQKLITEFGNIDKVYEELENAGLGKSARQKMEDGKELAYLSKKLATIVRDAPIGKTLTELETHGFDTQQLYKLLTELEFTSHIKRLGLEGGGKEPTESVKEESTFEVRVITPDGLSALRGQILGFVFEDSTAYLSSENVCYKAELESFKALAEAIVNNDIRAVVHDSKRVVSLFSSVGVTFRCENDVMLAAYVVAPSRSSYVLSELADIYLGGLGESTPEKEANALFRLNTVLSEKLKESGQYDLCKNIEIPLAAVLADMEDIGFKLDVPAISAFLERLKETESDYASRIYMLAGRTFNINSPKQLGEVLFEELQLPAGKKTKTGYSTNAEVLEKLRDAHPIVSEILEYREVMKLRSTYAEGLLRAADDLGRVHTKFNQTIAVTGRLSSTEPNLQNIPVRSELGREMRRFFVAKDEDHCLIDADYSQIELRLLAHIARDSVMTEAFVSGEDIHTVTASQVFGVPVDRVTTEMRKRAKAVNFGIVYGMGEFSLAGDIGVSRKEAGQYIKNYFEKYTGIDAYLKAAVEAAKELGYVETVFGRRRYIPELTSQKAMLRAFGERVAMNSPIQGSSADIIKLAMINVHRALKSEGLDAHLILQIHDELIIESSKKDAEKASEILKREMENVVQLTVPLTVDLQVGATWFDCK